MADVLDYRPPDRPKPPPAEGGDVVAIAVISVVILINGILIWRPMAFGCYGLVMVVVTPMATVAALTFADHDIRPQTTATARAAARLGAIAVISGIVLIARMVLLTAGVAP
jgi:hypothetical protein